MTSVKYISTYEFSSSNFTTQNVRKHRKLVSPGPHIIILILSFAFFHPHCIIHIFLYAFCHSASAKSTAIRSAIYRDLLFLDVFVLVLLVLIHLYEPYANLWWHDVTHVDLGTRSGWHSNVPEIKVVFFFFPTLKLFIYLLFYSFRSFCFSGFVSVVSFRCVGF